MAKQETKIPNQPDEVELGQLIRIIGKASNNIFRIILRMYIYFRKNIIWLVGLALVGALVGLGLRKISKSSQKLDVIVTPNVAGVAYLYDVISEIRSDIKSKDTIFFRSLDMDIGKMDGFEIEIEALREKFSAENDPNLKFIELLKDFKTSDAVEEILSEELKDKTTKDQRITFYFSDPEIGNDYANKLMNYINSNSYYNELLKTFTENASNRIVRNDSLVNQIDILIDNYTKLMLKDQAGSEGKLILENQEPLDIPSLFNLKRQLIREIESKKIELKKRTDAVTIINFGKPYKLIKPLYKKNVFLFPLLFIGVFFLISFMKYLNKKALQMEV